MKGPGHVGSTEAWWGWAWVRRNADTPRRGAVGSAQRRGDGRVRQMWAKSHAEGAGLDDGMGEAARDVWGQPEQGLTMGGRQCDQCMAQYRCGRRRQDIAGMLVKGGTRDAGARETASLDGQCRHGRWYEGWDCEGDTETRPLICRDSLRQGEPNRCDTLTLTQW